MPKTGGSAGFVGRRLLSPLMIEFQGDGITDICEKLNKRDLRIFDFVTISKVFSTYFGHILRLTTSKRNNLIIIKTKNSFEIVPKSGSE